MCFTDERAIVKLYSLRIESHFTIEITELPHN